jgi:ABC-type transport system substrate-binding protein
LASIGITVTLKQMDFNAYLANPSNFDMQLAFSNADITDPVEWVDSYNAFYGPSNGGLNIAGFNDSEFAQLTSQIDQEFDQTARSGLFVQAQEKIASDVGLIPFWAPVNQFAFSSRLHDFQVSPLGYYYLEDAWLD